VPAYRLALALREFELRSGLKPQRRLRWPVVSIGNLSTGGSGKTPFTIALASALTARGVHVDVLSRGYGRRSALPLLVNPNGTVDDFGDEPLVIAQKAGVPVYVAAERYEAGVMAEGTREQATPVGTNRQPGTPAGSEGASCPSWHKSHASKIPDLKGHDFSRAVISDKSSGPSGPEGCPCLHLLDDGFQHRQLHRDVNILLLSRADLNDHLLPAGNLREPLHTADRAHVIAIPADEPGLETEIRSLDLHAEVWRLRRRMEIPPLDGPVSAFCGIARPAQFFEGLDAGGVKISARTAFPDHHPYSAGDLERLALQARAAGATALVTTDKDRVRLGGLAAPLPIKTVQLRIEIENEADAVDWLVRRTRGEA
jgi:tetraacyldisaccharide 4'-kinase